MRNRTWPVAAAAVSAGMLFAPAAARAQALADAASSLSNYSKSDFAPRLACAGLAAFRDKELVQIEARVMPAAADLPEHCRVSGMLSPEIAFEVSLPAKWNGRFYMIGNGGHAGEALDDAGRAGSGTTRLARIRLAQTNTGHDARKEPGGVLRAEQPAEGHRLRLPRRAPHGGRRPRTSRRTTTAPGRPRLLELLLERWPSGPIEAQRFPDDFDGIVANAPWVDQTGFTIGAMWNQNALSDAPVTPAKLALVADKVMAKCDAIDGLKDGLIDDPRKCDFDPRARRARLRAGADGADCLTAAQAATIAKIYGGPSEQRQAVLPRLTCRAAKPSRRPRPAAATGSGWLNVIVARTAGRQAGRLQSGGKHDALSRAHAAEAGLRLHDVQLRSRHSRLLDRLEQASGREGPGSVEIQTSAAASCS